MLSQAGVYYLNVQNNQQDTRVNRCERRDTTDPDAKLQKTKVFNVEKKGF